MPVPNRNVAYDLSKFEPKRQEKVQQNNNIIELPNRKSKKIKPLRALSAFLVLIVMLSIVGTVVYSQVQLTELTEKLNFATKQLEESESVYTQLKMKSNSQLSLDTVETYAKEELGMKKIDANQVVCISLSEGDKGEVLQSNGGEWWNRIWNSIQNLLS